MKYGLPCPKCGESDSRITYTALARIEHQDQIRRRRMCANGHTFVTSEKLHLPVRDPSAANSSHNRSSLQ